MQPVQQTGAHPGMVLGIVGLVLGIISILLVWVPFLDFLLGAGGLVLGIVARRQGSRGFGLAALIVGIVATAIGVIYSIIWIIAIIAANHG
jgi:hypothetical protein